MLPLGRRVQDKLEALIDRHMYRLGKIQPLLNFYQTWDLTPDRSFQTVVILGILRRIVV
jgi:hypothetical protein